MMAYYHFIKKKKKEKKAILVFSLTLVAILINIEIGKKKKSSYQCLEFQFALHDAL